MIRIFAIAVAAFLISALPALPDDDITITTTLKWMPSDDYDDVDGMDLGVLNKHEIFIGRFTDMRAKKDEIGRSVEDEDEGENRVVNTRTDVAAWCAANFTKVLKRYKVELAQTDGAFNLDGEILDCSVTEGSTYRGLVKLRLFIRDANKQTVWSGEIRGESDSRGRSFQADNYCKALSDALLQAARNFLGDKGLYAELAKF